MSPRYTITEPHPTVPQNTYVHAGRGGAGNHFRAPLTTSPAGVPTPLHPVSSASTTASTGSTSSVSSRRFYSGRGGAGNAHSHIERPVISFEDEYSRADKREDRMVTGYHVGRGGAGNFASASNKKKSRQDSASSSDSVQSSSSTASGVFQRLSGVFKH